jgi:hypothetical protein
MRKGQNVFVVIEAFEEKASEILQSTFFNIINKQHKK